MRSDVTENKKSTLSGEKEGLVSRTYLCMDLKSFYASVECADRDLDPLTTNLVVADPSRTEKTICLAVSPSLKAYGISGRARLFEVIEQVRRANVMRKKSAPGGRFTGSSVQAPELAAHPEYQIDYLIAPPRMAHYMEVSTRVYDIYLKYAAPEDIHVYSIDEVFMDLTNYLPAAGCTAREYAKKIMKEIFAFTGLTATAGIGTNLYLAKIAMDIEAKHIPADEDGTRIAMLDEISYRRKLWIHQPITDFWRVGRGYAAKLAENGMYTMGDVARCSIGKPGAYHNEELLYRASDRSCLGVRTLPHGTHQGIPSGKQQHRVRTGTALSLHGSRCQAGGKGDGGSADAAAGGSGAGDRPDGADCWV